MRDVRLPDLNRLKTLRKGFKDIPPQQSANDTSNWNDRKIETFKLLIDDKEHAENYLDLLHDMDSTRRKWILDKVAELQAKYTPEEIDQLLLEEKRRLKTSE
jgi:hypothetical protein